MAAYKDWMRIVEAFVDGDREATAEITKLIVGWLEYHQAYDLRDAWDDLIQETLIAIVKLYRAKRLRDEEAFVNYVRQVVRHQFIDWLRRHYRLQTHVRAVQEESWSPVGKMNGLPESLPKPAERSEDPQTLVELSQALAGLSEPQKQAVSLIYLEGWSYQEAADRLDMALGTLKRHQRVGLRKLRSILLPWTRKRLTRSRGVK